MLGITDIATSRNGVVILVMPADPKSMLVRGRLWLSGPQHRTHFDFSAGLATATAAG